ncbi:hypothetical protein ULMS_11150 [Patiriisocius marinistellae]|uniref:Secretion system C-terminal sorting domain-containing protein n=1 Tax=Patiriisocius marinistellae TaxID=2494560 RepID=A0A5J4FT67_9FLAO|nr:T9SS type A sorting domain-containing protein [Patiriisocius marinistellae]GEQ85607.1 hypothetical protein ULMS_11150 [Patiriisocius marinistellae]
MKKLLLSVLFLFVNVVGFGQCPPDNFVFFGAQSEIDSFPTMYPNCTEINGVVVISGSNITDLSPLGQITSISGGLEISFTSITNINLTSLSNIGTQVNDDVEIRQNLLLESFTGLENINNVAGTILIIDNPNIENFNGFEDVVSIGGFLDIYDNSSLLAFSGFENLQSVSGFRCQGNPSLIGFEQLESLSTVTERIVIGNNDLVTSLAGFENIDNLDFSFWITDNLLINDISAFENLNSTFVFGIKILNNPALSLCNIQAVCENIGNTNLGYFEIENNGTGCENIVEVAQSCGQTLLCPPGVISLSSQAEVNEFQSTYPNCTSLVEGLTISGQDITNLLPLNQITQVGDLTIEQNFNLTSLNGLENIITFQSFIIGEPVRLKIISNPELVSLQGLSSLVNTEGLNMSISVNSSLENLDGLQGLQGTVSTLNIIGNDALLDLEGLSSIQTVDNFYIENNDVLNSLSGLDDLLVTGRLFVENNDMLEVLDFPNAIDPICGFTISGNEVLTSIDGFVDSYSGACNIDFRITDNPNLSNCSIAYVCDAFPNVGSFDVNNNAMGCNTINEIDDACTLMVVENFSVDMIKIYPNPTSQLLNIETNNLVMDNVVIRSISGKTLLQTSNKQIDISNFSAGVYFITIETTQGTITKKIVKE